MTKTTCNRLCKKKNKVTDCQLKNCSHKIYKLVLVKMCQNMMLKRSSCKNWVVGSVQKCSLKKDNLSWEEVLTTLISFLESTILYLWKWSVGSLFRTYSMCPDDDLSLSFLYKDLLHLALLCGLVQYSFDKGRAWWLAMTQPNRGEVQLYHGVFAKYVTVERLFFCWR